MGCIIPTISLSSSGALFSNGALLFCARREHELLRRRTEIPA